MKNYRSTRFISRVFSVFALAFFLIATVGELSAQTLIADYPLATNLSDATGNNGDMVLSGNPTPPSPPSAGNPLCTNGMYRHSANGQNAQTPNIANFDPTDFEIQVEFNATHWLSGRNGPVLMGGSSVRWIGFYAQTDGKIGIKHNNSNLAFSNSVLNTGQWYSGIIKYKSGTFELWVDNVLRLSQNIGNLSTGNNHNFTTNDFSSGANFNGCIRNLRVFSGTTLKPAAYAVGGTVSGLTGTGLALQNNGGDTLAVAAAATAFTFGTELLDLAAYAVTVYTQPTGQICTVTNGSGAIAAADVTNVAIDCVDNVITPAIPVPTLSQWALIMLSMLLGLMVFANRRRLF